MLPCCLGLHGPTRSKWALKVAGPISKIGPSSLVSTLAYLGFPIAINVDGPCGSIVSTAITNSIALSSIVTVRFYRIGIICRK